MATEMGSRTIWYTRTWWRHQMETFSALLALCVGNSPVTGEFPAHRPVTRSFDVFFDLRLNKPLSKESWGWWFETPSRSLWHHCNVLVWDWCVVSLQFHYISSTSRNVAIWNGFNSSYGGQNGHHCVKRYSDAFSRMKSFVFWLKFHWSLFLRVQLTMNKHGFR